MKLGWRRYDRSLNVVFPWQLFSGPWKHRAVGGGHCRYVHSWIQLERLGWAAVFGDQDPLRQPLDGIHGPTFPRKAQLSIVVVPNFSSFYVLSPARSFFHLPQLLFSIWLITAWLGKIYLSRNYIFKVLTLKISDYFMLLFLLKNFFCLRSCKFAISLSGPMRLWQLHFVMIQTRFAYTLMQSSIIWSQIENSGYNKSKLTCFLWV